MENWQRLREIHRQANKNIPDAKAGAHVCRSLLCPRCICCSLPAPGALVLLCGNRARRQAPPRSTSTALSLSAEGAAGPRRDQDAPRLL